MTVINALSVQRPLDSVHLNILDPYSDTVTVAFAVCSFGTNVAAPVPEDNDHDPVPVLGIAPRIKLRSHSSPPVPALASGGWKKLTVTTELLSHGPFLSVHLNV